MRTRKSVTVRSFVRVLLSEITALLEILLKLRTAYCSIMFRCRTITMSAIRYSVISRIWAQVPITSNVKSDKTPVAVVTGGGRIETGLKKFGAMVGDCTEVGCNSVLCPGTVLGKNCTVYPLSRVRGYVPENRIYKSEGNIVVKL